MKDLERALAYAFHNTALLREALTHPSYAGEHNEASYQRLEFLGDAVLQLAVSDVLYRAHPGVDEGKLTRARAALVRENSLGDAAKRLGLGRYIRLSAGEARLGGREKASILSDVCEAVIAAVYLDGGMENARALIERALGDSLTGELPDSMDYKSRLQELVQASGGETPAYEQIGVEGPPHAPVFRMRVVAGGARCEGEGGSKHQAQQDAARKAIGEITIRKEMPPCDCPK